MKYSVDYQFMTKSDVCPWNVGEIVGIVADDKMSFALLPNVGDFINIDNSADPKGRASFSGKVKSKLFNYICIDDEEILCEINIVVEENDNINWAELITH